MALPQKFRVESLAINRDPKAREKDAQTDDEKQVHYRLFSTLGISEPIRNLFRHVHY
jgi:hypothetical protein